MTGKKPWRSFRCRSCGCEFGWNGDFLDMPQCPHCNYDMPQSRKEKLQKDFDDMLMRAQKKTAIRKKPSKKNTRGKKAGKRQVNKRKKVQRKNK